MSEENAAPPTFISANTEFDVETRFKVRAAMGNPKRGLEILDMLDKHFEKEDQ